MLAEAPDVYRTATRINGFVFVQSHSGIIVLGYKKIIVGKIWRLQMCLPEIETRRLAILGTHSHVHGLTFCTSGYQRFRNGTAFPVEFIAVTSKARYRLIYR